MKDRARFILGNGKVQRTELTKKGCALYQIEIIVVNFLIPIRPLGKNIKCN